MASIGEYDSAVSAPRTENVRTIMHVITGLQTGGAERMLHKVAGGMRDRGIQQHVVSITTDGPIGDAMRRIQVPVTALGATYRTLAVPATTRLAVLISRESPDAVITWMYHANLIGGAAAAMARRRSTVIWNIRASALGPDERHSTRLIAAWTAPLAGLLAKRIIINSRAAMADHVGLGYPARMFRVIPNGFDLNAFGPLPNARARLIGSLGLPQESHLIGIVARYHPMKDFETFFEAASLLEDQERPTYFVLAGEKLEDSNRELMDIIDGHGLRARCRLLGGISDIPALMSGLDIFTLSSQAGESFPNVVGEAMACGIPCVATDVGGVREILGPTGRIVPRQDPAEMAASWREILGMSAEERRAMGNAARDRVKACFSLDVIVDAYLDLCRDVSGSWRSDDTTRSGICAA